MTRLTPMVARCARSKGRAPSTPVLGEAGRTVAADKFGPTGARHATQLSAVEDGLRAAERHTNTAHVSGCLTGATRLLPLLLLGLIGVATAASGGPRGFRGDGTARADAAPPATWTAAWTTPLGARGNGSPVVTGGRVLVTAEPDQLISVDLATGALQWRRPTPVLDTLAPELADPIRGLLAEAPSLEAQHAELRRRHSEQLRAFRAGTAGVTQADLDALTAQIGGVRQTLDALSPYRTPDTHDDVGYASPTPVTDGMAVWALFGTGVVTRYGLDGRRAWARWLGPGVAAKHGYSGVDAASPVLAGGTLIVPYRKLTGLDPATGAVRWTGPEYLHYGTPAVATVDGHTFVFTPAGEAVDAASGAVVATGLGDVYYTSPVVDGDRVYYVGTNVSFNANVPNRGRAWQLRYDGQLRVSSLWDVEITTRDRIYSVPVLHSGHLYVVTRNKQLVVLDLATGATISQGTVSERYGEAWAPAVIAGGALYAAAVTGTVYELSLEPPFGLVREHAVSGNAATPWFQGGAVLWRGRDALVRYGAL